MRKNVMLVGLVILFGILVTQPAPHAQAQGTYWEDGCIADVVDQIAAITDVIDYQAGCAVFRACDPRGDGNPLCQFSAFQTMVEQCPPEDGQCHDGAILFAAAMVAYDLPSGEAVDYMPPQTLIDGVPAGLEAFWQGDDAAALAQYQLTSPDDHFLDIAMPLSRAVLYQRLNQPEAALAEYDAVFGIAFTNPLAHYARSHLYGSLERDVEASFDVAALATFEIDTPEFEALLIALQTDYPLDESIFQDWLYYPVTSSSQYVVNDTNDLSFNPPRPIRVGAYDDLNLIVAVGLKNWNSDGFGSSDEILQILRQTEDDPNTYRLDYPEYWDNSGSIQVTQVGENVFSGFEEIGFFEGYGAWEFMIAPADAPDPRSVLEERRACIGGVVSRLGIGAVVTSISHLEDYPLEVTDTPAGEVLTQIITPYEGFVTVIGGPACVGNDSVTWWEGYHSDGTRGWFAENIGTLYNATPMMLRADRPFCDGAAPSLVPRLVVGESANVVPNLGANNVRSEPSTDAELLGTIPAAATFEVIGGPVCLDGTVWWYADYEGLVGWTVEGQAPDYWLAPVE